MYREKIKNGIILNCEYVNVNIQTLMYMYYIAVKT